MKSVVIFASGSGSNAENIIKYFEHSKNVKIEMILTNKKEAYVLQRADLHGISAFYFNRKAFVDNQHVLKLLRSVDPDLIVLAGFLWKMPQDIVSEFSGKIINIHPALLPKYGGKGMYGMHVHESVIAQKEKETGITIHYVNEHYDQGAIIFQATTAILDTDNANDVANKVHELEYVHFPRIIDKLLHE